MDLFNIMKKTILSFIGISSAIIIGMGIIAHAATVAGFQGGIGIISAPTSSLGYCPTVASTSPFLTYILNPCTSTSSLPIGDNITVTSTIRNGSTTLSTIFTASGTGAILRTGQAKLSDIISVKDFGAVGNTIAITDASMTAGSSTLDSASQYTFTTADIGKEAIVGGAGQNQLASSTNLVATITNVSGGNAILSANAVNTVSSSPADFGTPDNTAVANAAAAAYGKELYFPSGTYLLTNSTTRGLFLNGWTGTLDFSPQAEVMCDSMLSGESCVLIENSNNISIYGFQGAMAGIGTQAKPLFADGGSMLHLYFDTNLQVSNLRIYNAANGGVADDNNTDASFSNIYISSTTANSFLSQNSVRTSINNITVEGSGDSGLEYDDANNSTTPPYNYLQNNSYVANNILIKNSFAGINITGDNANISNFNVDGTCGSGLNIETYNNSTTGDLADKDIVSNGNLSNIGTYGTPNISAFCTAGTVGDGITWIGTGSVSVNNVKIVNATNHPIDGDQGFISTGATSTSNISLDNIIITSSTGNAILNGNASLSLTNSSMSSSTGDWTISSNNQAIVSNVKAYNVCSNASLCFNRAFQFGSNGTLQVSGLSILDNQAVPTGDKLVEQSTTNYAAFSDISSDIANGSTTISLSASSTMSNGPIYSQVAQGGTLSLGTLPHLTSPLDFGSSFTPQDIILHDGGSSSTDYGFGTNSGELTAFVAAGNNFTVRNGNPISGTGVAKFGTAGDILTEPVSVTGGSVSITGTSSTVKLGTSGTINTGCIEMFDSVNSTTLIYVYSAIGILTSTTTKPNFCL